MVVRIFRLGFLILKKFIYLYFSFVCETKPTEPILITQVYASKSKIGYKKFQYYLGSSETIASLASNNTTLFDKHNNVSTIYIHNTTHKH